METNSQAQEPRMAYMILETERTIDGAFVVYAAKEGIPGYFLTGWVCKDDFESAQATMRRLNLRMGISEVEAIKVILSTMGRRHG